MEKPVRNAMTIDVEDYFQVSAFAPHISRDSHAIVVYDARANEFFVERGRSRNLPLLNGATLRGTPVLKPRDVLQVGETQLLFMPLCGKHFVWED